MYNKINLMLPTRGRSKTTLPTFIKSAIANASSLENIRFTFLINMNDTDTLHYITRYFGERLDIEIDILLEDNDKSHLAKMFNFVYERTKFQDPETLVSMLGDDMEFRTKNYDKLILKAINQMDGIGIVWGDDCFNWHGELCVNLFTTRKYVDYMKPLPFMCELYPRELIDTIHYEVAKSFDCANYIPSMKIYHNHATRPGNGGDETYKNLLKENDITKTNTGKLDAYVKQCVKNVVKNIGKEFDSQIDVVMTTYNRTNLLEETVASYNQSSLKPDVIHVFDDKSESAEIMGILSNMRGAKVHKAKTHLGCFKNTPHALKRMFEKGSETVLILDSDVQLDKLWWFKINNYYKTLKESPDFGSINMLNLPLSPKGAPCEGQSNLLTKPCCGACGLLVTKTFWEKYVVPNQNAVNGMWDNKATTAAYKDGKINYVCSPSLIQHTGIATGANTTGEAMCATDFKGKKWLNKEHSHDKKAGNKRVLFSAQGRYGDIVLATMIINMISEAGYVVDILTIPFYKDFFFTLWEKKYRTKIKSDHLLYPTFPWGELNTEQMKELYPGYGYYINGQPGSKENHQFLVSSKMHIAAFVKERSEETLGITLPNNYKSYLPKINKNKIAIEHKKPLCIISPETVSTESALDEAMVAKLYKEYSNNYTVKILTQERPRKPFREIKEMYICGIEMKGCVDIIMNASLFIGNDSGLAWVSMLNSDCKKIIYHKTGRLLQTNCWYNFIDPNAEDVVV